MVEQPSHADLTTQTNRMEMEKASQHRQLQEPTSGAVVHRQSSAAKICSLQHSTTLHQQKGTATKSPKQGRPSVGRPPHALVTLGFGGKLIIMTDNSNLKNSLHGNKNAENHSIAIVALMEAVKEKVIASSVKTGNCIYFHALYHQSFPNPLVGGTVGNKELQKWIDDSISDCAYPYRRGKVLKLLLSLLRITCQHYQKLQSLGTDTSLRANELPDSAVVNLFASTKGKVDFH
ncbi:hypothetical protein Nepgr_003831 [Nepenthes gracilis]|uniref:Sec16 central conserved domain-containing protein n=1 Tax=Nepenthes gracilis TaxID=150966 RepID=A0AAD3XEB0_NEPGR|nr:hypothetical protein Nepgr_003831 [Nepenthes gracilis]